MKHWTTEEETQLAEMKASGIKLAEIAEKLGRSLESVRTRSKRLHARNSEGGSTTSWTTEEVEIIRQDFDYDELEKLLGRSRRSIMSKCEKLGISKRLPGHNINTGTMHAGREATLYLVDFGNFKKVGVTQAGIEERFQHEKFFKILDTVSMDLSGAIETEREILRNMRKFRVIGDIHRGGSECFKYDCTLLEELF